MLWYTLHGLPKEILRIMLAQLRAEAAPRLPWIFMNFYDFPDYPWTRSCLLEYISHIKKILLKNFSVRSLFEMKFKNKLINIKKLKEYRKNKLYPMFFLFSACFRSFVEFRLANWGNVGKYCGFCRIFKFFNKWINMQTNILISSGFIERASNWICVTSSGIMGNGAEKHSRLLLLLFKKTWDLLLRNSLDEFLIIESWKFNKIL